MKIPNWVKRAFKGTDVHWSKSQTQIHKLLNELGVTDVRFTNTADKSMLEFLIQVEEGQKSHAIRIANPIDQTDSEEKRTKQLNVVHRMLLAHLRAKFIAVGRGLKEFENEFMADLIVTDRDGNSKTMGELMLPQYKNAIESGENKDFKLLGDGI